MAKRGEIVAAVDFGSRDVRVLVAHQGEDGAIQILGHGSSPGRGAISQGVIQDLGAAQLALKRAIGAAEKESGIRVNSLFCGLNGKNVDSFIRDGFVKLDNQMVEVRHMEEALDNASRDILAPGKRVLSSITSQEWYVDDLRVSDPVGIRGAVLKTRVHFAQVPTVIEDNIITCIESQNKELEDIVFMPIAASLGCLTPEDIELGVAVLDMGRTTTGLSVYRDRRILGTNTFEWGGFHITRDVAAGLQVTFEEASDLILEYGVSDRLVLAEADDILGGNGHHFDDRGANIKLKSAVRGAPAVVDRTKLDYIVFERSKELLTKVRQHLASRGLMKNLVRGIVLTGGSALIRNQPNLAEAVFEVPARIGVPEGIEVMPQPVNSPEYAPIVGVLRHGFEYRYALRSGRIEVRRGAIGTLAKNIGGFFGKYFF